jgi:tRNA(fMet)-specific endonuclease VapC
MSLFLLDTDVLTLLEQGHPAVTQKVASLPALDIATSAISIQEQLQGFQAAVSRARNPQQLARAYDLLVTRLLPVWCRFTVVPFTEPAILRFEQLRTQKLNIGSMDLRIAAIALENGLTVVTRNQRDFGRVPGVVTVDWSV